ncbi:MAG: glutamate synthase [Myxococcales bacterium]|nr:glutamate synthase [Myxococcales bacterium]
MAELRPYPFAALIRRMMSELRVGDSVFDLPKRRFYTDPGAMDVSVNMHGTRAGSALGPAAGPQTQMAQNLVISYLAGCRIMELKTVQINDTLELPRPCIDMQTIGYNVEWSQELRLQESLEEYVKGSMLVEILLASGLVDVAEGFRDVIYDMSVGYDLEGIKSEPVQAFINGMMDCSTIVERFRAEIPEEFSEFRDLSFRTQLSDTLTLSTFHGCPPDEIEKIMAFLLTEKKLHAIAKLNPTLLGPERARELMSQTLGYEDVNIPDAAFENDTKWDQAIGFVERLGALAEREGRSFGVKFSNTLLVDNHKDFFPEAEKSMYLSGPPLHVLAMNLVREFRKHFGDAYPISFSAGIDRNNFADATAIGLTPITVCSDLLKPGGYSRAGGYHEVLVGRMQEVGAADLESYVIRAYGLGEDALATLSVEDDVRGACIEALASGGDLRAAACENFIAWLSAAKLLNTEHYVAICTRDERYTFAKNSKAPRKVGNELELFDCVSCNKCIPVCPNDANFAFSVPLGEQAIVKVQLEGGVWTSRECGPLVVSKKVQYGNFADFCNECGNCDIFCPEDGGPYVVKPRFFGSQADWQEMKNLDGFFLEVETGRTHARISGKDFVIEEKDAAVKYSGDGFAVSFDAATPVDSMAGEASGEVDLSFYYIAKWIRAAVLDSKSPNYLRHLG